LQAKTEYDVTINAEDIQQSETLNDLFRIIDERMG
jgi:acyl carrier protein